MLATMYLIRIACRCNCNFLYTLYVEFISIALDARSVKRWQYDRCHHTMIQNKLSTCNVVWPVLTATFTLLNIFIVNSRETDLATKGLSIDVTRDHDVALTNYKLKVKGPDIYIPPLTGNPNSSQRFTIRTGVLISTGSRRRGAISGRPLRERTDFGPAVAARQTHRCVYCICYARI